MSEPSPARPVPGPPRPGPLPTGGSAPAHPEPAEETAGAGGQATPAEESPPATEEERSGAPSFEGLAHRPVAEHVAVFETEHARLQRELGTIDQL